MAYSTVLKEMIEKSNLSYKEVSEKCREIGKSVDPSYISKLVNGKLSPPSDEISSILAKVCNGNERKLILEAYLEKSPFELISFLENIKLKLHTPNLNSDFNQLYKKSLEAEPLSDFILDFNISNSSDLTTDFTGGLPMNDDSMEPIIPKGSQLIITKFAENTEPAFRTDWEKTTIRDEHIKLIPYLKEMENDQIGFAEAKTGDIVAALDIDSNELIIRQMKFLEFDEEYPDIQYMLIPMNINYDISFCDISNTHFNLANINNNKLEINKEYVDILEKKRTLIIDGQEVKVSNQPLGVCIIGKVSKIIRNI